MTTAETIRRSLIGRRHALIGMRDGSEIELRRFGAVWRLEARISGRELMRIDGYPDIRRINGSTLICMGAKGWAADPKQPVRGMAIIRDGDVVCEEAVRWSARPAWTTRRSRRRMLWT